MNNAGFAFNKFIAALTQCVFGFHILKVTFNSCIHNILSLPGTGPGRRNNHRSGYKCKDIFLITKRNTQIFSKKFGPVHNPVIPTDGTGCQRLFKRGVRGGVLAQFEPMFVFGPLDHYTAYPNGVPDNLGA